MQIKYSAIIDIFQLYQRDLCKTPPFAQFLRLPRGMRSLFLWGQAQILILKILKCIPAYPACPVAPAGGTGVGPADRTGVVKIFAFLGLKPRLNSKNRFNWAGKIERFAKVSSEYAKDTFIRRKSICIKLQNNPQSFF